MGVHPNENHPCFGGQGNFFPLSLSLSAFYGLYMASSEQQQGEREEGSELGTRNTRFIARSTSGGSTAVSIDPSRFYSSVPNSSHPFDRSGNSSVAFLSLLCGAMHDNDA